MEKELPTNELEVVDDLIQSAFLNSAAAFSKFINKKVTIQAVVVDHSDKISVTTADENKSMYVLLSQLKGDLRGKCYLNFSPSQAKEFFRICLSPEYAKSDNMNAAILMELDNILTAAVVSIIANRLQINTFAYIPHLLRITTQQLAVLIANDYEEDNLILHFKTIFKIDDVDLSPEFIWIVEKKLINIILDSAHNS